MLLLALFIAFFIRPFYKMMLGKKIVLNDMQCVVCGMWYVVYHIPCTVVLHRMLSFTTV